MLDWFKEAFETLMNFFYELWITFTTFIKDFFFWLIEMIFDLSLTLLDALMSGLSALNPMQYFSAIPPETIYYMQITGFNECMGMLIVAITARFFLQLIPFVRLGS